MKCHICCYILLVSFKVFISFTMCPRFYLFSTYRFTWPYLLISVLAAWGWSRLNVLRHSSLVPCQSGLEGTYYHKIYAIVQTKHLCKQILIFIYSFTDFSTALKGVFAKNERGYRLNAIKKRFWSLLILLLAVASIRRKLLKTTNTEERSVLTNSERCNIQLGS